MNDAFPLFNGVDQHLFTNFNIITDEDRLLPLLSMALGHSVDGK